MIYTKVINDTFFNITVHQRISIFKFFDNELMSYDDCFEKWWESNDYSILTYNMLQIHAKTWFLSLDESSKVPSFDEIPKELISFFVNNAKEPSPFHRLQSNFTNNDIRIVPSRSNFPELLFPAPLNYNYQTRSWNSFYTKQPWTVLDSLDEPIPWYREKGMEPVYPILDDFIFLKVDVAAKTVRPFPYSSNRCSILTSLYKNNSECKFGHFWCREGLFSKNFIP